MTGGTFSQSTRKRDCIQSAALESWSFRYSVGAGCRAIIKHDSISAIKLLPD